MNENKLAAYQTLYECLVTVSKLVAPFAPFIAEELFQNLNSVTKSEKIESVHLSDYPQVGEIDKELEQKMDAAQQVVYLVRAIRAKSNLKVRQPLKKLIVVIDKNMKDAIFKMKDVILEELNIKELEILDDDSTLVHKSAKANFKTIGPKFGKNVKAVAEKIKDFTAKEISLIEKGETVSLTVGGEDLSISKDDVEILSEQITGWIVESDKGITVAVDTQLTPELISEGLAREFVNRVQNMRKDAGLQVTDKINIAFSGNSEIEFAINSFRNYIAIETLAEKVESKADFNGGFVQDWKIGGDEIKIKIEKVSV